MTYYCPYCREKININSKDHIFPDFLGGTKKINCCRSCNSLFGHTFEAKSSEMLQSLHVFISSWGLRMHSKFPIWKNAIQDNELFYNLTPSENSCRPSLSNPYIERDENGDIISATFSSEKEAKKFAESLIKKGKAKKIEIESNPPLKINTFQLGSLFTIDDNLKRLALKMCIGLYSSYPNYDKQDISYALFYLDKECLSIPLQNVFIQYDKYDKLDIHRKGLSHTIYIENNNSLVYGVVQFFGVIQLYCLLGKPNKTNENRAMLATLDPLNGEENFASIEPLALEEPQLEIELNQYPNKVQQLYNKFREESIKRGATHPPDLRTDYIDYRNSIIFKYKTL